jgi:hypothetical protein
MPWVRASSLIFLAWAVVFLLFPRQSNELGGIGYIRSKHAEDWTQIVGLFSCAFAVLLYEAHRSANSQVRRVVARSVLALTVPCVLLMTYWQLMPERRWIRLDIADIALLCFISYGMPLEARSGGDANTPEVKPCGRPASA